MTNALLPPTASEETKQTVIVDNGRTTFLGGTTTTVTVDADGVRRFTETATRVRASDGYLVDPNEPLYDCTCGKTRLTERSVTECAKCHRRVCHACIRDRVADSVTTKLCRACNGGWTRVVKDLWSWLVS